MKIINLEKFRYNLTNVSEFIYKETVNEIMNELKT